MNFGNIILPVELLIRLGMDYFLLRWRWVLRILNKSALEEFYSGKVMKNDDLSLSD